MSAGTLLLRADAGPHIGAGHVMRCLALGDAWRALGGNAVLAARDLPTPLAERAVLASVAVLVVDGDPADDAAATASLARAHGAQCVVADGYAFSEAWQRRVRGAHVALVCLDDDAQIGAYQADVVLDPNLGADADRYASRAPHTRLLLGSRYALLRPEFVAARRPAAVAPCADRLLVTFGGSDASSALEVAAAALVWLADRGRQFDVRVVCGAASPPFEVAGMRVEVYRAVRDMAPLMAWADLAVSAAGSTCWELAYMGVPAITVVLADNQRAIAARLAAAGASRDAGPLDMLRPDALATCVLEVAADHGLRTAMRARGRAIVDGLGARRVADTLLALTA